MSSLEEPSDKLLDLIYDAAADDSLWVAVLREIANLTNSAGGVLLCQSGRDRTLFFEHHCNTSDECIRVLKERHVLNPWTIHMATKQPVGVVVASDEILALPELRQTAFFDEVLRPQGLGHSAMIGLAQKPDFGVAFSMNRGPRQGSYSEQELRFLQKLTPHLQRSMKLGLRVDAYKALQRAEFRTLDSLAVGVILLDRKARILFANTAARSFEGEHGPLGLRQAGLVHASPLHSRRLNNLVQSTLRGVPMGTISVPRADGGDSLTILALAASVRAQDVDRLADANLQGAAVVLFIIDPANKAGIPATWLMDAYGLTPAEAKVALAVSSGLSIPETASQLHLSPNTIKTQLRNVFAKSGVNRQTDLARLIASIGLLKSGGANLSRENE
ncbi:helix-turn-helix transcriptional regulator [Reyranella sp.]|uniref:helix-turn-helix transcriptional regulator n=1 Tax=Reyranella sp. TaxID=1929291 RepID=UPI003D10E0CD